MTFNLEPSFGDPKGNWFRWFAWYPVETIDRGRVWLRYVWVRHVQKFHWLDGGPDWWWQYVVEKP